MNELQSFTVAAQLSNQNQAPIGMNDGSDFSMPDNGQNEVLKARLYKERLTQVEQRSDVFYVDHMAALERTGQLVGKLAKMNLTKIHFNEIIQHVASGIRICSQAKRTMAFLSGIL